MEKMPSSAPQTVSLPRALFVFSLLYGGLVVLAGVLGAKIASLGTWPVVGNLAVESGIFCFLLLVVLSSTTAELYGQKAATTLVRLGFIPLIVSMVLLTLVIHAVPPAPFWQGQEAFATVLGQGARMQLAGLISYGVSQTLNVHVFARIGGGQGQRLLLRAWLASLLSQVADTVLFITLSFWGEKGADGHQLPIGALMTGQLGAKLLLSTLMVPPLIWLAVRLGRRLDRA
nr:queuosine precursor transporter [Novosphingobium sp. AAP1]